MDIQEKIKILTDAAKYDVSCSSSGSNRKIKWFGGCKFFWYMPFLERGRQVHFSFKDSFDQ